jgi:hypothetical protein
MFCIGGAFAIKKGSTTRPGWESDEATGHVTTVFVINAHAIGAEDDFAQLAGSA